MYIDSCINFLKIEVPEIQTVKTINFPISIPISEGIKLIHSKTDILTASIPVAALKYYTFFIKGQSSPLDIRKPLKFYNVSNLVSKY